MGKEHFTFDEVNELIPQLEYHFQKLLWHKKEMAKASFKLGKMGVSPQLIGHVPDHVEPKIQRLQSEVKKHYREFKQQIFAIENMGGDIKDLELGRVDFPSKKDGEDMVLTWQLGVTKEAYLHGGRETHEGAMEISVPSITPLFSL